MATWLMIFSYIRWQIMIHLINCQYHLFDLWSPYGGFFPENKKEDFYQNICQTLICLYFGQRSVYFTLYSLSVSFPLTLSISLSLSFSTSVFLSFLYILFYCSPIPITSNLIILSVLTCTLIWCNLNSLISFNCILYSKNA